MEEVSKTISEMQQRIASKLRAVGANSRDKAVTTREADFDVPEQNWLDYIAGIVCSGKKDNNFLTG